MLYDLNAFLNQHKTAFEFNPWHCFTKNTAVDTSCVLPMMEKKMANGSELEMHFSELSKHH